VVIPLYSNLTYDWVHYLSFKNTIFKKNGNVNLKRWLKSWRGEEKRENREVGIYRGTTVKDFHLTFFLQTLD
jgi:hypothetical protein